MCLYSSLIWIIVVLPVSIGHSCDDRQDVKYVNRCPETIDEWNAAAEKKNCQYVHDDCPVTVTEYKLEYHCVKVRNQPIFVELCSKVWKSQGRCVDFEPSRNMVTSNFDKNCTTCPEIYKSTDVFKIPECYMDEKHETTPSKPAALPYPIATPTSPTQQGSESWLSSVDIPIIVIITLLFIILVVVITLLIIQLLGCCKACKVANRRVENADTESIEFTELPRH
nr:uncharacterized protein LOC117691136 [Crassostrea gigas]